MTVTSILFLSVFLHVSKCSGWNYGMDPCGASGGSCNDVGRSQECMCRTYTFATIPTPPLLTVNPETGEPCGPLVTIIEKICETAGKQCKFTLADLEDCWNGKVSNVLNNRWYDACVPPGRRPERLAKFDFPNKWLAKFENALIVTRGDSNITAESLRVPHDYHLGWIDLPQIAIAVAFEAYLNDGYFMKDKNIVKISGETFEALEGVITGLECGQSGGSAVDFIILPPTFVPPDGNFTIIGEIEVDMGTTSIMVRKDEQCMLKWYNEAYEKFICSDEYPAFCKKLSESIGNVTDFCQNCTLNNS